MHIIGITGWRPTELKQVIIARIRPSSVPMGRNVTACGKAWYVISPIQQPRSLSLPVTIGTILNDQYFAQEANDAIRIHSLSNADSFTESIRPEPQMVFPINTPALPVNMASQSNCVAGRKRLVRRAIGITMMAETTVIRSHDRRWSDDRKS